MKATLKPCWYNNEAIAYTWVEVWLCGKILTWFTSPYIRINGIATHIDKVMKVDINKMRFTKDMGLPVLEITL